MRTLSSHPRRTLAVEALDARICLSASMGPADTGPNDNDAPLVTQMATATPQITSTVPTNGDVNPYGVAFVPGNFAPGGVLQHGDILVSNFNNASNAQGTGTTITRITASGQASTFFQGSPGLGLTTALGVLHRGFVLVGNMPTTDGTSATVQQGSLLVLDKSGNVVTTLSDNTLLDGPWDMAVRDEGNTAQVFVSNVLTGTVTRIDLKIVDHGTNVAVQSMTQIASGYTHHSDPAALEVGPTGLVYDHKTDTLYVASSGDNAVYAISHASRATGDNGTGRLVYRDNAHLHGPLGMVQAPNGDLIVANGDAVNADPNHSGELVEFTTRGRFVSQFQLDPAAGSAFGLALATHGGDVKLAAVNDDTNSLEVFNLDNPRD